MRTLTVFAGALTLVAATAVGAHAQVADSAKAKAPVGIEGKWRGSVRTDQGDQDVTCIIKKETGGYSGSMTGPQGDIALQEIKLEAGQMTATAILTLPDMSLKVWYSLALKDDTLKGTAETSFNGQSYAFDMTLKRVVEK